MARAGVSKIDHLVITHYHEDHYGGADDLVNALPAIEPPTRGFSVASTPAQAACTLKIRQSGSDSRNQGRARPNPCRARGGERRLWTPWRPGRSTS